MSFVAGMVFREIRGSWRRLVFFFICVAVGVGGIVALRSLVQTVRVALAAEARSLTAGDVYLRSDQPWSEEARSSIRLRMADAVDVAITETVDTVTMARVADRNQRVKVVEARGVRENFPFYGRFVLESGEPYRHRLLDGSGAIVARELLAQLGVEVGDHIVLGDVEFVIRDVLVSEPGRQLGGFSFGPRILIDYADLERTGLLTYGSRVERQMLLRVPEEHIDVMVDGLRDDLKEEFVSVGSYRRTENRIERNLSRAENYLSLIGFVILLLGGIGIWSVTRVFVQQKTRSVAVLKCIGATSRQILSVYVTQVAVLGCGGSVLGVAVAYALLMTIPESLTEQASIAMGLDVVGVSLTTSAIWQGLLVGLLVSILFAIVTLLGVRDVKPLLLLRSGEALAEGRGQWKQILPIVAVGSALLGLASWQADSFEIGAYFVGGGLVVALVLYFLGRLLVRLLGFLELSRWFALRHAVLHLRRPGNQTQLVLMSVGLASFLIIGVRAAQENLEMSFALELRDDMPDMFMIDIQQDQVNGVRDILARTELGVDGGAPVPQLLPVLRARVTGVTGARTNIVGRDAVRSAGFGREYTVTYRSTLQDNERIVAGAFWNASSTVAAEVSIEDGLVERGIELGDVVSFDILGRQIEARVTSVRTVDWDDTRSGGFMFLFRPGVLDNAPHSFISFVQGPSVQEARAAFQNEIAVNYPNVSVIDGVEVIRRVRRVLDYVTLVITVVGGIALFAGTLVLIGSVATTKFQRLYDAAVFKTLGARTITLALMYTFEYGVLGLLAGLVGSIGALLLTWLLTEQILDTTWVPVFSINIFGVLLTTVLVLVVGVLSSIDVIFRKPLLTLRSE